MPLHTCFSLCPCSIKPPFIFNFLLSNWYSIGCSDPKCKILSFSAKSNLDTNKLPTGTCGRPNMGGIVITKSAMYQQFEERLKDIEKKMYEIKSIMLKLCNYPELQNSFG